MTRRAPRRRRSGVPGLPLWLPAVVVALLVVLIAVSPDLRYGAAPPGKPALLILGPIVNATLSIGPPIGVHLANPFYSVVFQTGNTPTNELQTMGAFFNTTPITLFRFGGPEAFDPTTSTLYVPPPASGTFLAENAPPDTWNFTWMKAWCDSRTPHCDWLGYLPAEENNSQAAVHLAEWFHDDLGFAPTYWQFGNEPQSWSHFGENLSDWATYDDNVPTGLGYASMVRNDLEAVHARFPTDQFVGIESSTPTASGAFVPDTAALVGSSLAALAYHFYPLPASGSSGLEDFYDSLVGPGNLTASVGQFRAAVDLGCSTCSNLPLQIGEYQAGPADAINPLTTTYAGAPYMAASLIEALRANVSTFTPFDDAWFIDPQTGTVLPEGLLYQRILENMTMGTDVATGLSAPGVDGLFSILIENGTHNSLLVVNTDPAASIRLPVQTSFFPIGSRGSYWEWGPTVPDPIASPSTALPVSYEVPEEGILLIDNY